MRTLPIFALLALPFAALASDSATVSDLLKNGAKYDKKAVVVTGKVDKFVARTSQAGKPYFLFKLKDGDKFVSIYGKGKLAPEPKDGDSVEVMGEFEVERHSGSRTYKNEIDATPDKKTKFGVKPLKK
jgi:hypothetical protein